MLIFRYLQMRFLTNSQIPVIACPVFKYLS